MNKSSEMEKGKPHILDEIIEYLPKAIVCKTIIKKSTGNITAISMSAGEELAEKITRFDTYVQIIDGTAVLTINGKKIELKMGQGIIIPANASQIFSATNQFKMITTIIKCDYEE
jgi:quercetin dioxygenase-like cupin family protein